MSNGGETQVKGCVRGPISVAYDATSHNGSPALVAFIAGEPAIEWANQSVSTLNDSSNYAEFI